ncbi:MAG TPA: nucleoside triphosphate pyrophosphohydrolase, partial [Alcanivorax sp.]|nr:nucleoside triphosphate pyrophosphohydrolase [Alcanivorax sp.]
MSDNPNVSAESAIAALLSIMARLRDPDGGCPWDLKQDFDSIVPYTV